MGNSGFLGMLQKLMLGNRQNQIPTTPGYNPNLPYPGSSPNAAAVQGQGPIQQQPRSGGMLNPQFLQSLAQLGMIGLGGKYGGYMAGGAQQQIQTQQEMQRLQQEAEDRRRYQEAQIGQGKKKLEQEDRQLTEQENERKAQIEEKKRVKARNQAEIILSGRPNFNYESLGLETKPYVTQEEFEALKAQAGEASKTKGLATKQKELEIQAKETELASKARETKINRIITALAGNPEAVLSPDRTEGIDPSEIESLREQARQLKQDRTLKNSEIASRIKENNAQTATALKGGGPTAEQKNYDSLYKAFREAYPELDEATAKKQFFDRMHAPKGTSQQLTYEDALRIAVQMVNSSVASGTIKGFEQPSDLTQAVFKTADAIMEQQLKPGQGNQGQTVKMSGPKGTYQVPKDKQSLYEKNGYKVVP